MQRLICTAQSYEWGSRDSNSVVGKLARRDLQHYAEFWIGTHPNGPSYIEGTGQTLRQHIGSQDLPFLLKFLSVDKALSIQLHPTKALAEELRERDPSNYKDSNHKPEMAIAITRVSLLCGFRDDWQDVLCGYPEIPYQYTLKELIEFLLTGYRISTIYDKILDRVGFNPTIATDKLFVTLSEQHYDDKGALLAIFMNHITLEPGEAISIEACVPHAYLSGDMAECMACSDNVIRAGLTNKYKDINTFISCVSYDTTPPLIKDAGRYYSSGFEEFDVAHLSDFEAKINFYCSKPSLIAVVDGSGYLDFDDFVYTINKCMFFYIPSNFKFSIHNMNNLDIWIASESNGFSL